MIKFFRKIRQNMIKENKVSKYMLYAIGEIILVVIGILIAIQINNWHESNKEDKLTNQYRTRLVKDFEGDFIAANKRATYFENVRTYALNALQFIQNYEKSEQQISLNDSTANKALVAFYLSSNIWKYIPARPTYNDLINTGKLYLLGSVEDRNAVIDYYRALEQKQAYWDTQLKYREHIRSIIPVDLQEEILNTCEIMLGSTISTGGLKENCIVSINPEKTQRTLSLILKDEETKKNLTYLASDRNLIIELYNDQKQSSLDIVERFKDLDTKQKNQ